jgi:hypothetical protein
MARTRLIHLDVNGGDEFLGIFGIFERPCLLKTSWLVKLLDFSIVSTNPGDSFCCNYYWDCCTALY